jgi:ABC-type transporter Mla MlaB component
MLRISIIESAMNAATLRLEGQIAGPWTGELSAACERMLAAGQRVTLDLEGVSLIDRPALAQLSALSRRAVKLVRCSPFHEEQLKQGIAPHREPTSQTR